MFSQYRRVFAPEGSVAFSIPGLVGRLPSGMGAIAATVAITSAGRSYTIAGAAAAAFLITVAVTGPFQARLVDRHGQARIAVPAVVLAGLGAAGVYLTLRWNAPTWALLLAAAVNGLGPNLGALVRARWTALYQGDEAMLHTAYSMESVADEICFVLGPVVAMALCTSLFPSAGLLAANSLLVVAVLAFAAQRGTEPEPHPYAEGESRASAILTRGMPLLVLGFVGTGAVFGSVEISTVGFAQHLGHRSTASYVIAAYALGSGISGFFFGLWKPRGSTALRFRCCLVAMIVVLTPLVFVHTLPMIAAVLLIAGLATAPTIVTGMALVHESVPEGTLTEGLTWAITGLLIGVSAGSAIGGWTVDQLAPGMGFRIPVVAAALALVVSLFRTTGTAATRAA